MTILVWLLVSDERFEHNLNAQKPSLFMSFQQLGANLKSPSVRLAFWIHFVIQSPGTVMVLLWGMPFLVEAEGLERDQASFLMSLFVFVGIGFGFLYGQLSAHRPQWRKNLVLTLYGLTCAAWICVLSFPGGAPYWSLLVLFVALGVSGPGSMLAFDFTKTAVPKKQLGSANGFVNIGGFLASFTMMFAIGALLDFFHLQHADQKLYSAAGFRFAFPSQFVFITFGVIMFLVEYSKANKGKSGNKTLLRNVQIVADN
jgi:sugar phosphate permease